MSNSRVGGGGYKKKNYFKMKDGDVIFRILPPYSEINKAYPQLGLPDNNAWAKFHSIHFGYKNSEGKIRPFESPQEKNKEKEITVRDAALDRLNELKEKLDTLRKDANSDPKMVGKLNALVGMKGIYSIDNNHHMNVVDLQGNVGTLKIRHKAKLALDIEIKKLEDDGVDPLSLTDGRFFVFSRSGMSNETGFKVVVYEEKIEVPGFGKMSKPLSHKADLALLSKLKLEASDLNEIATKLTAAEVANIVATSDLMTGKSPACDEYFDARWKAARAAKTAQAAPAPAAAADDNQTPDDYQEPARAIAPVAQPAPAVQAQTPTPAPAAAAPQAAPAAAASVDDMSDDEFFKAIGAQA